MADVKNVRTVSKELKKTIPAGATILRQDESITVEEIENGYLISKSFDIKYQSKNAEHSDYLYYTIKFYSETNPITVDTGADKSLAEAFK
jgi:hypothetical protein